tara:strand:- start:2599 stop:2775 length:177 start_codon:yes stop_codon:yes gene_type:complete
MTEEEALITAHEILFSLDAEKEIRETLLTKLDISDSAYENMMAWLIKTRPELDEKDGE